MKLTDLVTAASLGLATLGAGCAATNAQVVGGEQKIYANDNELREAAKRVLGMPDMTFIKPIKVDGNTYFMTQGTQAIVYQLAGLCEGRGEIAVQMNSDGTGKFYTSMETVESFDGGNPMAQKVAFLIDSVQCASGCTPGDQILKGPQETVAFTKDLLVNPGKYSGCTPKVRLVEFIE